MSARHDPYQSLRFRDFRGLLIGTTFAFVAAQLQSLVLGWEVYERTHDPLTLGWIQSPKNLGVWPFYAIQSFAGVSRALSRPASQALGTDLIPREVYGNAATWRCCARLWPRTQCRPRRMYDTRRSCIRVKNGARVAKITTNQ